MPRSRLIARADASASSSVAPRQVTCPILRAAPRLGLAVEVQLRLRMRKHAAPSRARAATCGGRIGKPQVAEQVHHHGGRVLARVAQRQPGEHARLLLELRGHAGVDRVVAAVVRARRDLVDEQRAVGGRRTSRRTARRGSRALSAIARRDRARLRAERRRRRGPARSTRRGCRRDGDSRRPARSTASPSLVARDDHRDFAGERHERSSTHGAPPIARERRGHVVARAHARSGPCRRSRSARS